MTNERAQESRAVSPLEKAERFRELHRKTRPFVIPNPWDVGSARLLAGLGFPALATTSSGFALTLGREDGQVTFEEKLAHCRELAAATEIPVTADLENGFADDPAEVARHVRRVAETGVVGCSIEDYRQGGAGGIYGFQHAVERVAAAVEAARELDLPFTLTARTENQLRRQNDFDDTLRRLQAFEGVGADVLYAPGLTTLDEVRAVTGAVGRPVNVLAPLVHGATIAQLGEAGAVRLSLGGALMRATLRPLLDSAAEMEREGTFDWTTGAVPGADLNALLSGSR